VLLGIFHSKAMAAGAQSEMRVISNKLPVYQSFADLSENKIHLDPNYKRYAELSFNDKVTILNEKNYAAQISMGDGRIGWVHRAYLKSDIKDQLWLVKKERNMRNEPNLSKPVIDTISSNKKVFVLEMTPDSKFYRVQTTDGLQEGWIYNWYLENEQYPSINGGSNVIPYEFGKEGTVTNSISIFTPLNTKAKVTANQLNQFVNYKTNWGNTFMTGMGSAYVEAQNKTNVNAIYLLAHSGLETSWGDSTIVKSKKNYYGINANDIEPLDDAYDYASKSEGIVNGAIFINQTYINRDKFMADSLYPYQQPTLDNMRFNSNLHQYSTDEAWASKIAQIANEFSIFTANTGWKTWGGKWYYFNNDWTLKTGWTLYKNKWYYLNKSGVMLTGWQWINGKWYYLNPAGDMKTDWLYSGGKWYYLDLKNGDMKTGWLYTGGKWYYLNNSGAMQTGWIKLGGKWYYLYKDGHMAANTTVSGYRLGKDGAML
jgi:glucan-binding YG repeat protein